MRTNTEQKSTIWTEFCLVCLIFGRFYLADREIIEKAVSHLEINSTVSLRLVDRFGIETSSSTCVLNWIMYF